MARMKTELQIQSEIASLEDEIKKRKIELKRRANLDKAQERKKRDHALIVFGAMVEKTCGGDWKRVDPEKLEAYCKRWADAFVRDCTDKKNLETLDYVEANKRIRAFESKGRKNEKSWEDPRK